MTHGAILTWEERYGRLYGRLEASWDRWCHALDRVPARAVLDAGVCGHWSVKDLIGHVAIWDDVAARRIHALCNDEEPVVIRDVDGFNLREADLRIDRNINDLLAELRTNHNRVLSALQSASRGSGDMLERVEAAIADDTWNHYDEHRKQIDAHYPEE